MPWWTEVRLFFASHSGVRTVLYLWREASSILWSPADDNSIGWDLTIYNEGTSVGNKFQEGPNWVCLFQHLAWFSIWEAGTLLAYSRLKNEYLWIVWMSGCVWFTSYLQVLCPAMDFQCQVVKVFMTGIGIVPYLMDKDYTWKDFTLTSQKPHRNYLTKK